MLHALAKRADDRYQTAAEFRADVERAIAGSPGHRSRARPSRVDRTQMMPAVDAAAAARYEPMYDTGATASSTRLRLLGAEPRRHRGGRHRRRPHRPSSSSAAPPHPGAGAQPRRAHRRGGHQSTLQQYELRLGAQTPATSDRPEGTVIAQQPAAGESIEQGQSVNVTVSSGLEQATVPQLVALTSVEDARIALQDANLALGRRQGEELPAAGRATC